MDEGGTDDSAEPIDLAALDGVDDAAVEQLFLATLQNSVNGTGDINPEVLEELGRDFPGLDFAELLQQLQAAQGQDVSTVPSADDQKLFSSNPVATSHLNNQQGSTSSTPVPSPAELEIEIVDLADNDDVLPTDSQINAVFQQSELTIIQAEGGITICHDGSGEDLRPKPTPVIMTLVRDAVPKVEINVKMEKATESVTVRKEQMKVKEKSEVKDGSHHHHKDKKKDKEKHRDREKHREERERKKRLKEERMQLKPPRHPDFLKLRKKFNLVDTSVTVIRIDTIIPVSKHMRLKRRRLSIIEETDRKKQNEVNNADGKVRLVPRPRPAFEYEKAAEAAKKRVPETKISETKRKKIRVFSDSSSESDSQPSKKPKDKLTKPKPHGEFSATGARILPFEKVNKAFPPVKEESLIKRPKMTETELKKETKRDRLISNVGSEESTKKLQSVLDMAIAKQKEQMRLKEQEKRVQEFRIPKANTALRNGVQEPIERPIYNPHIAAVVSTTPPLNQLKQPGKKYFDNSRKFASNSYGQHRQAQVNPNNSSGEIDMAAAEAARLVEQRKIEDRMLRRAEADQLEEEIMDMHDDAGSDENEVVIEPPPVPVSNLQAGPLARNVCDLLVRRMKVEFPTTVPARLFTADEPSKQPSLAEITIQKCAWWFQGIDKQQPAFRAVLTVPMNPEADDMILFANNDGDDEVSSFGNISNPDGDRCQINEVTSTADHADIVDEFCGRSLIGAQFRIAEDEKFQNVLDCPRGTNYDRKTFTGTCTICKVLLKSKRELGAHARSEDHRTNFKKISLSIMPRHDRPQATERVSRNPLDVFSGDMDMEPPRNGSPSSSRISKRDKDSSKKSKVESSTKASTTKEDKDKTKNRDDTNHGRSDKEKTEERDRVKRAGNVEEDRSSKRRRSRSRERLSSRPRRSRSPRHRRRSRSRSHGRGRPSPRRRSTSAEKVAKFLERTRRTRSRSNRRRRTRSGSLSPPRIRQGKKQPQIFAEKLKLQAAGKWTQEMESNWTRMEAEEQALDLEVQTLRDVLSERPEEHPRYETEWQAYWKKTYHEVERSGKNADSYNYVPGWKAEWGKITDEMMHQMHFDKLGEIRVKYGMDLPTLQRLLLDLPVNPVQPIEPKVIMVPVAVTMPAPIVVPGINDVYTPFDDDLQPRAMSLSGSSGTGVEPPPPGVVSEPAPTAVVTTDTIQKTWALLTRQPISTPAPPKSDKSGSSAAELDLEMELIEVLRIMNTLEDQLSLLAPQVADYVKMAETMELMGKRKSYDLLEDKDFVSLLFQSRDKFMALIRANILTREVLKRMNKAVFGLNSILDLEQCQRLRPNQKQAKEVEVFGAAEPEEPMPDFASMRRPDRVLNAPRRVPIPVPARNVRPFELSKQGWDKMTRVRTTLEDMTTWEQRQAIGRVVSQSVAERCVVMTDGDLVDYVHRLMQPALKKLDEQLSSFEGFQASRNPVPVRMSVDGKRQIMSGMGTALPPYPELQCRAVEPPRPPPPRNPMVPQYQPMRGGRPPLIGMAPRPGLPAPRMRYNAPQQLNPRRAAGRASLSPVSIRGRPVTPRRERTSLSPLLPAGSPGIRPQPLMSVGFHDLGNIPRAPASNPSILSDATAGNSTLIQPLMNISFGSRTELPQSATIPSPPVLNAQPGCSKVLETENRSPKVQHSQSAQRDRDTQWEDDGSIISSDSIGGDSGSTRLKKTKSIVSNGSAGSAHRWSLKEVNAPADGLENLSDVESGEILSSEDALSTSSSVHKRRQKLKERIEAMKLVEQQRLRRRKEPKVMDKRLEKWFEQRRAVKENGKNRGKKEGLSVTTTSKTKKKVQQSKGKRNSRCQLEKKQSTRRRRPNSSPSSSERDTRRSRKRALPSLPESRERFGEYINYRVELGRTNATHNEKLRARKHKPESRKSVILRTPPVVTLTSDEEVSRPTRDKNQSHSSPKRRHRINREPEAPKAVPYFKTRLPEDISLEVRRELRRQRFQNVESPTVEAPAGSNHSSMSSLSLVSHASAGFGLDQPLDWLDVPDGVPTRQVCDVPLTPPPLVESLSPFDGGINFELISSASSCSSVSRDSYRSEGKLVPNRNGKRHVFFSNS